MNKREFLDLLRYYLRAYPENIINDIVSDYEEHFHIGKENGKSEEQICSELGSPKDIADEFLSSQTPPSPSYNNLDTNNNSFNKPKTLSIPILILAILGALLVSPAALGVLAALFASFIAIIVSLLAVILALVLSGMATIAANFIPIHSYVGISGYTPHILTSFFLGIFLIGLSILIGWMTIQLLKLSAKGIQKLYLSIRWRILKRRKN